MCVELLLVHTHDTVLEVINTVWGLSRPSIADFRLVFLEILKELQKVTEAVWETVSCILLQFYIMVILYCTGF